jgi:hypothetical protein
MSFNPAEIARTYKGSGDCNCRNPATLLYLLIFPRNLLGTIMYRQPTASLLILLI